MPSAAGYGHASREHLPHAVLFMSIEAEVPAEVARPHTSLHEISMNCSLEGRVLREGAAFQCEEGGDGMEDGVVGARDRTIETAIRQQEA